MSKKYLANQPKIIQRLTIILVVIIVASLGTYLLGHSHSASFTWFSRKG